tara:strand:+ start:1042 stop:2388 length:1347 start_codon:yes stop_codon:yes gene_type:complete
MPLSSVLYTANGSTTQFDITFSYIDTTHIKVFIDNVEDTSFTFVNTSRIQTSSTPSNGAVVKIERQTPDTARLVDFQDGSVLTETDLDKSANQNFFIAQETVDEVADKLGKANDGIFDAGSTRIKNVANPTADQDAVTKNYLENTFLTDANKTALTNVNANISNINAVNSNSSNINTVAGNNSNINTVAGISSDITTLAGTSGLTTLANNSTNVNTVAGINSEITTVAGISSNVTTVAGISSDVTAVAGDSTDIGNVSGSIANVNTVATNISNVNSVAGISSNVTSVAGNSSNINTVAGNNSNISTVAGNNSNITTVAGANANISTVAGSIANVNTTATNIADVNSFANRYRIGSSDPTSSLDEGDLFFNTTSNELKFYDGSSWSVIQADTDVKTKVSSNDTTAGFLNGKLVAGSNISFTENSDGGNETLTIASSVTDNSIPFSIALG